MKRQKNMEFVMLVLVTATWKYAILKSGILVQIKIQDRKRKGKKGKGKSVKMKS
jgi:hypothetical protein